MSEQEQMLDHAIALLVYLLSDSTRLKDPAYQHQVRQGINGALRRYIDAGQAATKEPTNEH